MRCPLIINWIKTSRNLYKGSKICYRNFNIKTLNPVLLKVERTKKEKSYGMHGFA